MRRIPGIALVTGLFLGNILLGISIGEASPIVGWVVDAEGNPVSNASVEIAGIHAHAVSDSNGQFATRSLPSGTYTLTVRRAGFWPVRMDVEVHPGEPTAVRIVLRRRYYPMDAMVVTSSRAMRLIHVNSSFGRADHSTDRVKTPVLSYACDERRLRVLRARLWTR